MSYKYNNSQWALLCAMSYMNHTKVCPGTDCSVFFDHFSVTNVPKFMKFEIYVKNVLGRHVNFFDIFTSRLACFSRFFVFFSFTRRSKIFKFGTMNPFMPLYKSPKFHSNVIQRSNVQLLLYFWPLEAYAYIHKISLECHKWFNSYCIKFIKSIGSVAFGWNLGDL